MFHILLEINLNEMLTRGQRKKENKNKGSFLFFCLFQQWESAKWLNIHGLMTKLFSCESNLQVPQLGWSILKFSVGKNAFI